MPNFLMDAAITTVGMTDVQPVFDALAVQLNVTTIIGIVAGVISLTIGIVFMWWAARYGTAKIFSAFRKGKG